MSNGNQSKELFASHSIKIMLIYLKTSKNKLEIIEFYLDDFSSAYN